jgi:salicylate hydroxylase
MRRAYERFLLSNFPASERAALRQDNLGGVPTVLVAAPVGATPTSVVLHFHGGGYVVGSAQSSVEYAERLAKAFRASCISVDYRLAPENSYPAALDDALSAYFGLIDGGADPHSIILSGESSGAGLAIALAMSLRDMGRPLPAGILAVCPFADLSLSGETVREREGTDPAANRDSLTFMAASYFQDHDPRDPRISPLFGDFNGLPPIFLTATANEALFDDAVRIRERALANGVEVTYRQVEDSVHVFPLFGFLPEAREVLAEAATWGARILPRLDGDASAG